MITGSAEAELIMFSLLFFVTVYVYIHHKGLRTHERRVQRDDRHLHGGSLAACGPNRHRTPFRCPDKRRANLTLDKWGFALLVGQEPRGSTDSWRSHHDAVTHVIYRDTIRAGIEGRTEVRGVFSSLLPPANARRHR